MSGAGGAPTIAEARAGLQARRWSALELLETTLERVERRNPDLNAYIHLGAEEALAAARSADAIPDPGPLHGIPICVKDVIDVAGMPTTAGAAGWERRPSADATAVARLREAGAIVVGKGNTNEFAYGIDGRNPHWGDVGNPFDPDRVSGGSSSGPAAATATGMALAGIGTDTTGSIRVPASLCGLVGVRPTRGLVPTDGVVPLAWSYDTVGLLTRTVPDAAVLLDVLLSDGRGANAAAAALDPNLEGRRVGLCEELLALADDAVAAAVRTLAEALASEGADVVPMRMPAPERATAVHRIVQSAEASAVHAGWFEEQRDRYADDVRTRLEAGRLLPAELYLRAQRERRRFTEEFAAAMAGIDAVLAPTTPVSAPRRDAEVISVGDRKVPMRAALLSCTLPISQLDCPAVSVPLDPLGGLPIGAALIGRPHSEPLLIELARAVETTVRGEA